jgi:hypothetical protein
MMAADVVATARVAFAQAGPLCEGRRDAAAALRRTRR